MATLFDLNQIPVLETERLRLCGPRPGHAEPYIAMLLDDEVSRFIFGPFDRQTAWRSFATVIGHWALLGYGQFMVEERRGGRFVGRIGLINPPGWPGLELGWTLDRAAWGNGYAVEAAAAVKRHAVATLQPARLISLVDPRNLPSVKVAQRLGAAPAERIRFAGVDVDVWSHPLAT